MLFAHNKTMTILRVHGPPVPYDDLVDLEIGKWDDACSRRPEYGIARLVE